MYNKVVLHYTDGKERICITKYNLLNQFPLGIVTKSDKSNKNNDFSDIDINMTAVLNGFICSDYSPIHKLDNHTKHCYQL